MKLWIAIFILIIQVLLISGCSFSDSTFLDNALEEAGDNRVEIVNALRHFREQGDPEKEEAARLYRHSGGDGQGGERCPCDRKAHAAV